MFRVLIFLSLLTLPQAVSAQQVPCASCGPERPVQPTIDPRFRMLQSALEARGGDHPIFGPDSLGDVATDGVSATLRMTRPLTPTELHAWEQRGLRWLRHANGELVEIANIYGAFVPFSLVEELGELPLRRAEVAWQPISPRPLQTTTERVGAVAARQRPDGVDGTGRLIVDIDSFIDVLHPHFFRADGGRFEWIDANASGAFEPGADGVDLDGNGELSSRERLLVLDASLVDFSTDSVTNDDDELQPELDWLFADLNGDGRRNVGTAAGFTEEDPGYGEPLFVVEDVDKDGVLEPGEVLYMLGTSKIVEVVSAERTWRRGRDLIEAADSPSAESAFHATGVASILLGGQANFHAKTGVAPGADVIVHSARDDAAATLEDVPQLRAVDAAAQLRADVVLHEWTNPYTAQHDGSTNLNAAMDAAREAGIVQVTPVGNMNLSGKHIQSPIGPGRSTRLSFDVSANGFGEGDGDALPYSVVYLSLFWTNNEAPLVQLELPDGSLELLRPDGQPQLLQGTTFAVTTLEQSDRGTSHLFCIIYSDEADQPVLTGQWAVVVDDVQAEDELWGRVADFYSGWSRGVTWTTPTVDLGTLVYPSTADSAIGVGAFAGVVPSDGSALGDLRDYSGRGPRIDGARGLDLVAPDDPIAALAATPSLIDRGYGRSWFGRFGGTSGSGPHVAGAVALLRQQDPSRDADEIESLLAQTADASNLVPDATMLPDNAWGFGRLDVYASLFGESAPANQRPIISAVLTDSGIDASASSDPDGDDIEFRYDLDHDGIWETPWTSDSTYPQRPAPGAYARVEVRDPHGERIGVLLMGEGEAVADAGSDAGPPIVRNPDDGCCSTVGGGNGNSPVVMVALLLLAAVLTRRR